MMMKTAIVGFLLIGFMSFMALATDVHSSSPLSKSINSNTGSAPTNDTIVITAAQAHDFHGNSGIVLYLNITRESLAGLLITLTTPYDTVTILDSFGWECNCENMQAHFSDYASIETHEVNEFCPEQTIPCFKGYFKPHSQLISYQSGNSQGNWTISIKTTSTVNGHFAGTLTGWSLTFSNDFDNDGVLNRHDNCPFVANPSVTFEGHQYQRDENQNGIGNECECDDSNFRIKDKHRRVCLYLNNWGVDTQFYKGLRKNPGDWAEAVMPIHGYSDYQPGDYGFHQTWLDCNCDSWDILP